MNEALSIGFLDISDVDKETFDRFMYNYKLVFDKLCVNPKTGQRTQNIFQLIPEKYNDAKKISSSYKIIYLYKSNDNQDNYEIVAFAIISNPDRFTTILEMLCSSIVYYKKTILINGKRKRLGISLLDDIYSEYVVKQKSILKIEPARPELLTYYTDWKPPSLPIEWFNQGKTYGYLIYSNDIKDAADPQLQGLIHDVMLFNSLCSQLDIIPSEVLRFSNKEERREFLTSKINEINDWRRDQLINWLKGIDYFSVDEIRKALNHIGGKKHRRKTKHTHNRRQKRTRKTKYV